jgi:erythromycin esterase-like protein
VTAVSDYVEGHETELLESMTDEELTWLRLHITSLRSHEEYRYYDIMGTPHDQWVLGVDSRDGAMAEIFQTYRELRFPGRKIVFTSHNMHLATNTTTLNTVYPDFVALEGHYEDTTRMGVHLEADLGADYVPVGLFCYQCSMQEWEMSIVPDDLLIPEGNPMVESVLHELGAPYLFVDLSATGETAPFVQDDVYRFFFPVTLSEAGVLEAVPLDLYDAMFYVETSEPWTSID